jgi:hypothetical protein
MTVCAPDGAVVCNATPGQAGGELCGDNTDNDCDGQTDEGFVDLGQACTVGVGACEQSGRRICDPRDGTRTACDRQPGMPQDEVCDLRDNDCDERTDEDFDLQTDILNCGRCGNPCNLPNARPRCAAGECTLLPEDCFGGFRDQDGIVENGCECNPNAADTPDPGPLFTDTNCDGVDGDADRAVFVSIAAGDDRAGTGRVDGPYRTLEQGVSVARLVGAAVYLDAGTYDLDGETLVVPAGVSIHGGYRYDPIANTWSRGTRDVNASVITGAAVALRYENLNAATMLDNVVVRADDAAANESSVAILAVNVGEHLVLRNVRAEAGRGGAGRDGDDGRAGSATAASGLPGLSGADASCPGCGGAAGLNNGCPNGTAGGRGGDGGRARTTNGAAARTGDPGAGDGGGEGGELGAPMMSGGEGDSGEDGAHGANASAAPPEGRIDDTAVNGSPRLMWVPRQGGQAGAGTPGGGGGGGGGGGALNANNGIGGGGGGGGAGGCAGAGGRSASGGGGSFALQIVGGNVHIRDCELIAGQGGAGGEGGTGGAGAPGSDGQAGGGRGDCPTCGLGGVGGDGGRGGCGGNSGGGAGGPSFAIFRVSTNQLPANLARSSVVYETAAGQAEANQANAASRTLRAGEAGPGGAGGGGIEGCGMAARVGADGYSGLEGCCRGGVPAPDCGDLTVCAVQ